MEKRIRNFVYNNDYNYTSYGSIKCLMICVCWFMTLIVGTYAIIAELWLFILILIIINCSFLLHLILLKFFLKNTYALRFLSDGIVAMLLSSLFLTSAYTVLFAMKCDTDFVKYGTFISYVLFIILYVILTAFHSKSNKYQHSNQSLDSKRSLLSIGTLIPVSGMIGMIIARIIFGAYDFENQVAVYVVFIVFTIVALLFSIGYVNFVKYYYCKKYNIDCDDEGKDYSPRLIPSAKDKKRKIVKPNKERNTTTEDIRSKKKLILKIICIISFVPIICFLILLFLGFFLSL